MHTTYLATEVIMTATPLMEPDLSNVTELLMNKMLAENPTVNSALMRNENVTNAHHMATLLQCNVRLEVKVHTARYFNPLD